MNPRAWLVPLALTWLAVAPPARAETVPFDSGRWRFEAGESRVEQHLGRPSLYLEAGIAWVEDSRFTDGIIEFDMAFTEQRGFMGVVWRMQDTGNYEEFYVRPHQSGNPDANQYTPAFSGLTSWQLYHGPGYGAPVEYPYGKWLSIKVVVSGSRAEVYIGDMKTPAVFIPEQKRAVQEGRVGLNAFFAPAHFSSFRFRSMDEAPELRGTPPDLPEAHPATIRTWRISDVFDGAGLEGRTELDASVTGSRTWTELTSEASGLTNLARVSARGRDRDTVFARVTLRSDRVQRRTLTFGYSDRVRLYLGGRLLYAGDNGYRSRDYRYLGTIGYFDAVVLPLEEGDNDVWLAVSERFGGWGLQAHLDSLEGITLTP